MKRPAFALACLAVLPLAGPARADLVPQACPHADLGTLVTKCEDWVGRDDTAGGFDQSFGVVATADASITLLAGHAQGKFVLVSRDAVTGAVRWRSEYTEGWGTQARDIAISPDRSVVVVTGLSIAASGFSQALTIGYDAATGARRWVNHWQSPWAHGDLGYAVTVAPDGATAYVTGMAPHYAPGVERGDDIPVIAINPATGATRWSATWDSVGSVGNHGDIGWTIGVSPDGAHVVVAGRGASSTGSGFRYATLSYRASDGALEWHREYAGPGTFDEVRDVAFTPDSATVVVTGDSHGERATVAYALATGAQRWVARFGLPGGPTFGAAVAVSGDGSRVYVTGESVSGTLYARSADVSTQALSITDGGQLWEARYTSNTLGGSMSSDVAEHGGTVYVSGASLGVLSGWNFLTLAYDPLGLPAWIGRYTYSNAEVGHTQQDNETELALSPSGDRLYVSGTSDGGFATDWDSATLAFRT